MWTIFCAHKCVGVPETQTFDQNYDYGHGQWWVGGFLILPCYGVTHTQLRLSEFTTVVSVLWLGPEWVGRSGQSTTDPAVVRHIWGKIRAED